MAAETGPSGWSNQDIADICRMPGGPTTLKRWCAIWTRVQPSKRTVELWTAGIVTPLDQGEVKPEPGVAPDPHAR